MLLFLSTPRKARTENLGSGANSEKWKAHGNFLMITKQLRGDSCLISCLFQVWFHLKKIPGFCPRIGHNGIFKNNMFIHFHKYLIVTRQLRAVFLLQKCPRVYPSISKMTSCFFEASINSNPNMCLSLRLSMSFLSLGNS